MTDVPDTSDDPETPSEVTSRSDQPATELPSAEPSGAEPLSERRPGNGSFVFVIPCAVVFIVTIFVMITAAFGQPASPLSVFLDRHGMTIILVEAGLLVAACFLSMTVDRWLTRRALERRRSDGEA